MMSMKLRHEQDADPMRPFKAPRCFPHDASEEALQDEVASRFAGASTKRLAPEQRLYASGAAGGCAYMVTSGIVRFERTTLAGARRIIRVAGKGDLIGQESLLGQGYRDDVIACSAVSLRSLSVSLLDSDDWRTGRLSVALLRRWQDALDESEFWSTEVMSGLARRRVLQLLARLYRHRDVDETIWLPKRDQMADMLGITLETCSRMLSALRRDHVVKLLPPRRARLDLHLLSEALRSSDP